MLYDFTITYLLNGVPAEFDAAATSAGRALEDLVRYVTVELQQPAMFIDQPRVTCQGPSTLQI